MRKLNDQRCHPAIPLALLLLTLMLLTSPRLGHATVFSYTSADFTVFSPNPFPPTPAVGNSLSFHFRYDGPLIPIFFEDDAGAELTMTSGDIVVKGVQPLPISSSISVQSWAGGLPAEWIIFAGVPRFPTTIPFATYNGFSASSGLLGFIDSIGYEVYDGADFTYAAARYGVVAGVWSSAPSPAPIPGSLPLLGSGILGLVGIGIRRKST